MKEKNGVETKFRRQMHTHCSFKEDGDIIIHKKFFIQSMKTPVCWQQLRKSKSPAKTLVKPYFNQCSCDQFAKSGQIKPLSKRTFGRMTNSSKALGQWATKLRVETAKEWQEQQCTEKIIRNTVEA